MGCLATAAIALILWHVDVAFVAAALGAVCWFLDLRTSLRAQIRKEEEAEEMDLDEEVEENNSE